MSEDRAIAKITSQLRQTTLHSFLRQVNGPSEIPESDPESESSEERSGPAGEWSRIKSTD